MNNLKFNRTNGNVPKTLAGNDHISGLVVYVADADLPIGFTASERIKICSNLETAESLGITSTSEKWLLRVLHYQLSELFRVNNGVTLYLGLFSKPTDVADLTFLELKRMQQYAGGDIRQLAVWCGDVELSADHLTALQGVATALEIEDVPLSIVYAPKVTTLGALPKTIAGSNQCRVSVVIGQAGSGKGFDLYNHADNVGHASVSAIGVVLGLISAASVHESIGWVQKFPTGISLPAFGDGSEYRKLDSGVIEALDNARYIFFRTFSGFAGSYVNDSHTMDAATSDYAMIESVRTMDKAVRGIRTYLIPELGSPLTINPSDGKLAASTIKHLETVANKQLGDMLNAGELSGYSVSIDPNQNVLSSSTVEFVIKNVAKGVFRKGNVKIGYATSV